MTSRQALLTVLGSTQASIVMPVVRSREAESGMLTRALVPLKLRALPNLPAVDQVALLNVPLLFIPERSVTVVPCPSLKPSASTRPDGAALATVTVTAVDVVR